MANEPVNDGFITADFVGGIWDGKTHDIPFVPEWRVAIIRPLSYHVVGRKSAPDKFYDVAVYKHIGHGLYWLARIEKNER